MTLAQHLAPVTQCSRYQRWITCLIYVNILAVHAIFPHSQINAKKQNHRHCQPKVWRFCRTISYSNERTGAV